MRNIINRDIGNYIAGFVDGEGSFHVAVQRNKTAKNLWQIIPEFHVSQRGESKSVLELIMNTLACGYIKPNHHKNPKDTTWVYVVRSRDHLLNRVIPFFNEFSLRTTKQYDYEKFSNIVHAMDKGHHRSVEGLIELLGIAFSMNNGGARRRYTLDSIVSCLKPSETTRQTFY
jgi:hypothetical protein